MFELVIMFFWLFILGLICAGATSAKGRSAFGWFLLAFLIGPFAVVAAFLVPRNEVYMIKKGFLKKCPSCAEAVKNEAVKCKYCGEKFQ